MANKLKRNILIAFLVLVGAALLSQCARIVAPTGGPKDETPPVMVKSNPPLYATNFNGKKVVLTFDEFIQISGLSQKLIVSPPQKETPEIKLKGKSLELIFKEPLIDSTTYTLYFSDAIADNNEGNKIPNFEFAFSTGSIIDSLTFSGMLVDAYSHEPQEGVLVMLYASLEDSLPLTTRPLYVTKSNKDGNFTLSNLRKSDFKIFALADMNSNYIFDQITESIAFTQDTVKKSMLIPRSQLLRLATDTIPEDERVKPLELRLFAEENRVHSIIESSRDSRRRLRLVFTRKPEKPVVISPVNVKNVSESWFVLEQNLTGDTLSYWITNPLVNKRDTILMSISYLKTDSSMNLVPQVDTLRFFFEDKVAPDTRQRRRRQGEEEKPPSLPVNLSFETGSTPTPTDRLRLRFNMPLMSIDTTRIILENQSDSTIIKGLKIKRDSLNPRFYYLDYPWEANVNYKFTAMPRAFFNLDTLPNDTTSLVFIGADPEFYGTLNVKLDSITPNVIVELLTEKGNLVRRQIATANSVIPFTYVTPGKYYFRFILDVNRNGKWDTGWYEKGIQPEKVIILKENNAPKIFNVRANWEYDVEYNLSEKTD